MTFDAALERFQRQCSRMETCSRDIYRKALTALDGDAESAARLVASLVADRFIDDRRYASAFAREKASLQGWGPVKISFQLRGKGIPEDCIRAALADIDTEKATAKLDRIVADKYRVLREDPQCKLKLLKFALGRGYGYDEVAAAVDRAMKGAEE